MDTFAKYLENLAQIGARVRILTPGTTATIGWELGQVVDLGHDYVVIDSIDRGPRGCTVIPFSAILRIQEVPA